MKVPEAAPLGFRVVFDERHHWRTTVTAWWSQPAQLVLIFAARYEQAGVDDVSELAARWVTVADVKTLAVAVRKSVEFADLWVRDGAPARPHRFDMTVTFCRACDRDPKPSTLCTNHFETSAACGDCGARRVDLDPSELERCPGRASP